MCGMHSIIVLTDHEMHGGPGGAEDGMTFEVSLIICAAVFIPPIYILYSPWL